MPSFERPFVPLLAGHVLWHVFSPRYGPTSFNPFSRNRYAAHGASPPRAMFYAGDTPAGALWETALRDLVPDRAPPYEIELPPLGDLRIARLKLRRTIQVLPLYMPDLRWVDAGDLEWRMALQQSTVAADYTTTHAIAVSLLQRHPDADGLRCCRRQLGRAQKGRRQAADQHRRERPQYAIPLKRVNAIP
jgi:hypothetical protein